MNRYMFTDTSVRELFRITKKLYETFKSAKDTIVENPTRSINSDFALDYALTPWEYYYFMHESKSVAIHRHRNGTFSLLCYGFKPSGVSHYDEFSDITLYRNLFGRFSDFGLVLKSFKNAVIEVLNAPVELPTLFGNEI